MSNASQRVAREHAAPWWAGETAIRVSDLPRHLPPAASGKRVSAATAFRWTLAGLHGVRLRRFKIGGSWHTTCEELARWSRVLTEACA
ncbi:MAG: DUF1580 domain-containing protein [Planctomycetes bacterium]|nr:DUF1580 domain-containing protein [Planctomycetota bacterium]